MSLSRVAVQTTICAPLPIVWSLVSDPGNYAQWSPEAQSITRRRGEGPFAVGDTFIGSNRVRLPWLTVCTVVERSEHQRFTFDVDVGPIPIARWSYELDAHDGDMLVREIWIDRRTGVLGTPVRLVGPLVGRGWDAAEWNRRSMEATLRALKAQCEGDPNRTAALLASWPEPRVAKAESSLPRRIRRPTPPGRAQGARPTEAGRP